ncbi:MAG: hypothetical protein ACJ796_04910 [Gemmatimonadaceae bacterium]
MSTMSLMGGRSVACAMRARSRVAALTLLTALVCGGVTSQRAFAQDSTFKKWPSELASRGPALLDGIAKDYGERPFQIEFRQRDEINIVFWNPAFWHAVVPSREIPKETLPIVEKASRYVADYVWTSFARDAGINVVSVTFVRVRKEHYNVFLVREVRAQTVAGYFDRKQLETGKPERATLSIVDFDVSFHRYDDLLTKTSVTHDGQRATPAKPRR